VGNFDGVKPVSTEDGTVTLHYKNGGDCLTGSGKAETIITFVCNDKGAKEVPTLDQVQQDVGVCQYQVRWPTCHVCPGINPCHDKPDKPPTPPGPGRQTTPSSHGSDASGTGKDGANKSSPGVVAAVIVVLVVVVILGVFFMLKPERRARLLMVFGRKNQPQFKYQKMQDIGISGAEEGRNLFDDDSDDSEDEDTLLALE
jgi:hypothetical protein